MSTSAHPLPELTKLAKIKHISQPIGEFLVWLKDQGLLTLHDDQDIEELLARYFHIDLEALNRERKALGFSPLTKKRSHHAHTAKG